MVYWDEYSKDTTTHTQGEDSKALSIFVDRGVMYVHGGELYLK